MKRAAEKPRPRRIDVPQIKQQKKRMRLAAQQRLRNRQVKSSIRTLFHKLEASLAADDKAATVAVATELASSIDKAAAKGVIHANNAARKQSRVARMVAGHTA
jgi:small subunit ribosomal protein S20